ncbi:hypothetical protein MP228_012387 [Amoeboaphelidium protococcarum]|nr:hypothetical protein MP228_012387 [Amoeboaphelidium protococcarum]
MSRRFLQWHFDFIFNCHRCLLITIRVGDELNREQLEFLETLKEEEDVDIKYQMRRYYLFATRRLALDHNLRISESVTAEKLRYKAKDTLKEEYRDIYPDLAFCERVDDQIELWINAVVMVVANFKGEKIFNGNLGRVIGFDEEDYPIVRVATKYEPKVVRVKEHKFELVTGTLVEDGEREQVLNKMVVGERFAPPLMLAYGLTVHKVQGGQCQNLTIDFWKYFANGHVYVALEQGCS